MPGSVTMTREHVARYLQDVIMDQTKHSEVTRWRVVGVACRHPHLPLPCRYPDDAP
jgi:hypothetical protein